MNDLNVVDRQKIDSTWQTCNRLWSIDSINYTGSIELALLRAEMRMVRLMCGVKSDIAVCEELLSDRLGLEDVVRGVTLV